MNKKIEREADPNWPLWKRRLHEVIFEADTPGGKLFDVALLVVILLSVLTVVLESVADFEHRFRSELRALDFLFTVMFTVEYVLRILCVRRKSRYICSFFGVVDLLAVLPGYISLILPGSQSLSVIRALRLMRVFRVFKLARYVSEGQFLVRALKAARPKMIVFLLFVLTLVVIIGSAMYIIEGEEHGFSSIPHGIYWAVVTMTTVGYGDIVPGTVAGKVLASIVMILGYAIIAVPTGIVSVELVQAGLSNPRPVSTQACPGCSLEGHDPDAVHCKHCGDPL